VSASISFDPTLDGAGLGLDDHVVRVDDDRPGLTVIEDITEPLHVIHPAFTLI
jgi:hypothetical protein